MRPKGWEFWAGVLIRSIIPLLMLAFILGLTALWWIGLSATH